MLKKIKLRDAVGTKLAHDLTEIRPGEFKGAAFRKGHSVCNEDLCHLQKLGWTSGKKLVSYQRHLYHSGRIMIHLS